MRLKGLVIVFCISISCFPLYFLCGGFLPVLLAVGVVFVGAIVLGAIFIRLNFFVKSIHHGNRKIKKIALTFDDGPHFQTPQLLAILEKYNAKASFFCIGQNIENEPQIAQQIVQNGHFIGNHTHTHHRYFDLFSSKKMQEDIEKCNFVIQQKIGIENTYFRPPYGVTNPPLAKAIRKSGLQSIGWSLRTYDTNKKSALELKEMILKKVKNGDIILLHDRTPQMPELLNEIIPLLQERGMEMVTIKELLTS